MLTKERKQDTSNTDNFDEQNEVPRKRTPEEIAEARARILAISRPPRPLPPGKTWQDVIVGQWPGDETDEEIRVILEDLS